MTWTTTPTAAEVEAFKAAGLARLNRLFVGVEDKANKGHMPVWVMSEQEWESMGSPATGAEWEAALS